MRLSYRLPHHFRAGAARSHYGAALKHLTQSPSTLVVILLAAVAVSAAAQELRWAGDPEGGAPYVEASPANPDRVAGFDVEIADLLARRLGRPSRFVTVQFQSIDQSVARGDAHIGLSGIEDTPARRATMAVTVPYYEFREVLSVRLADTARFRTLFCGTPCATARSKGFFDAGACGTIRSPPSIVACWLARRLRP